MTAAGVCRTASVSFFHRPSSGSIFCGLARMALRSSSPSIRNGTGAAAWNVPALHRHGAHDRHFGVVVDNPLHVIEQKLPGRVERRALLEALFCPFAILSYALRHEIAGCGGFQLFADLDLLAVQSLQLAIEREICSDVCVLRKPTGHIEIN